MNNDVTLSLDRCFLLFQIEGSCFLSLPVRLTSTGRSERCWLKL